jgi:hypothetical protein
MVDHMMCDLTLGSAVNNHGVSMAMMPRRIACVLIVGEIINRAQYILLVGWISVGVEVAGQPLDLRQSPRSAPLLAAET